MSDIFIEALNVPREIKTALRALGQIQFTKETSKGANGYLFFGRNTVIERDVAVKFHYWGGNRQYLAEPQNLAKIESPNVIKIYDAALADREWAYFVTPYCRSGDFDNKISGGPLGIIEAVDTTAGILNGLTFLHAERFVHRDLKPANILIGDDGQALIGDFGSVRSIPDGSTTVPGSGHSILYRPPESFAAGTYGIAGDLYQVGLVLFQLLGGYLPYEETAWLNLKERKIYAALADPIERSLYADKVLQGRVSTGQLVKPASLPAWVPNQLKRAISRACNTVPDRRFESASAFATHLHQIRPNLRDWRIIDNALTLVGPTSYRIVTVGNQLKVEKRRTGDWRSDNTLNGASISDLVAAIQSR